MIYFINSQIWMNQTFCSIIVNYVLVEKVFKDVFSIVSNEKRRTKTMIGRYQRWRLFSPSGMYNERKIQRNRNFKKICILVLHYLLPLSLHTHFIKRKSLEEVCLPLVKHRKLIEILKYTRIKLYYSYLHYL